MNKLKILVMSDSHGREGKVRDILTMHDNADYIFFLGDGAREAYSLIDGDPRGIIVAGNCDSPSLCSERCYTNSRILDLGEIRILATHGHMYGVKYSLDKILYAAEEKECKIALYGHTHKPAEVWRNGVLLFNPGSVAGGSYGIISIQNEDILASHGSI